VRDTTIVGLANSAASIFAGFVVFAILGYVAEQEGQQVCSDAKVVNRDVRDFGWVIAHGAVTRHPPNPLDTKAPRTGSYAYDVGGSDLSIVQGPFSVTPCETSSCDSIAELSTN
jgi:hypothetical protein